jgi:hypothetical protein
MFILLRFCCATVSAYIFVLYLPVPAYLLFQLSRLLGVSIEQDLFWYSDLVSKLKLSAAACWMATWALLELRNVTRTGRPTPKLLTHLRYGPIAVLIFSAATILASDFVLIQYSRWQIVRWIHSDAPVTEKFSHQLHNNDRGWCGNGRSATEYDLYGATAAAYIDDADPAIRARALQASMYVYDWVNKPNDGPSIAALKKATADPDPMVRDIAAEYNAELFGSLSP